MNSVGMKEKKVLSFRDAAGIHRSGLTESMTFTKEGILLDGTKFGDDNCAVFENNGLTCLLHEFNDDTKVDIGKLAMWRIGTHSDLSGTWLSDYVENKLGGFSLTGTKKPDCPLIGQNGNIFNLMGIAAKHCGIMGLQSSQRK